MKKSELIKIIKEEIQKINEYSGYSDESGELYQYDVVEGEYHYVSMGPSYYTWEDWKTRKPNKLTDFGNFNSPQSAKKAFLQRHPIENNYYHWNSYGYRLFRNNKPIMLIGNSKLYK